MTKGVSGGGGGLNKTFDRATHLLWKIHLCKNTDTKFVSMYITGEQADYNE